MKKLTKTELANALCSVQLEHAKRRSASLKSDITHNKQVIINLISDYLKDLRKDEVFLNEFIVDNFDALIHCKFARSLKILDAIDKHRALTSEHTYIQSQIECPALIKKRVDYLRDPTMTVAITDEGTIYNNKVLEAERKRIFGD